MSLLHEAIQLPEQPSTSTTGPSLSAAEQQRLLDAWNATELDFPRDLCLHDLVAAQAARTPDATALIAGTERLNYADLNARADQLAAYLRTLGVGPEVFVALALDRSVELIVSLLAVLKAGAAYVPLDPAYPRERLAFILQDTRAQVILTREGAFDLDFATAAPGAQSPQVVWVDRDWTQIAQAQALPATPSADPSNLAYIIYTSGSTGRPKGVAIPHTCAVAFVYWALDVFRPEQLRTVLFGTSICFDLSIFELFVPLSSGNTVVLAANVLELPYLPAAGEVTLVNSVPSAVTALLRSEGLPANVRTVNLAGEPLPPRLVRALAALPQPVEIYNLYGPSETTTYSTGTLVPHDIAMPTIGRPIGNTQVYLLDKRGQPVPLGEIGELYIGGVGVTRGYLNRPDLTAERFVPNPFLKIEDRGLKIEDSHLAAQEKLSSILYPLSSTRLYRTGDLARFRADGEIEFLGRADNQVKLRGFRIELGEIEAALEQHPAVREAVVTVGETPAGEQQLVAYLVPTTDHQPLTTDAVAGPDESSVVGRRSSVVAELREYLRARLPKHMVPGAYMLLEALPLTPNGKIDRKALPAPQFDRSEAAHQYEPPQTPTEQRLAELWSQLLNVESIGRHDNFLDLGGHSLIATRMVSALRESFGVELSLNRLLANPSLADLAGTIDAGGTADQQAPITARGLSGDQPLSATQQQLWFLHQMQPDSPQYHIVTAYHLTGRLDLAALEQSLNELVRRHAALRTTFPSVGGAPVQRVADVLQLRLSVSDLSANAPAAREQMAQEYLLADAGTPFDLVAGPLVRATVIVLAEQEHLFVLNIHHIVSDGWSMEVLIDELVALYQAAVQGQPIALPEPPVSFTDYVAWQGELLQSETLRQQSAYWRKQLDGAPALLELPTDLPRPAVQGSRGAQHAFEVPQALVERMEAVSRQEGATLFMSLLAAWATLLARHANQDDLVIGAPIAYRTRHEIEQVVGCFTNTLPMRVDLSGAPNFTTLLHRVREMALQAYAHQDMPFEQIVNELQPQRSLSYSPIYQVMFAFQNQNFMAFELPNLTVTPVHVDKASALTDLMLELIVTEQGLRARLEYSTDLFEAATIRRMAEQYLRLLDAIAANPAGPITRLPLLSPEEITRITRDWSATASPVPAERCYVLDRHGELVPVGVHGELYLGQYDPGAPERSTERLAGTGELVRWRPDGTLEPLGRIDRRVRLHGLWIDLGEIEATLAEHPAVHQAAAQVCEQGGASRLVAYLTLEDGGWKIEDSPPEASEMASSIHNLRSLGDRESKFEDKTIGADHERSSILHPLFSELGSFLADRLPDYMIPATFMVLPALPTTPAGEVNYLALPAPEPEVEPDRYDQAPRNEIEAALAAIWSEVLCLHEIGVRQNFFDIGGNSLLVTRIVARVRESLRVELPLRTLFEAPTIVQLAPVVEGLRARQPAQPQAQPAIELDSGTLQRLLADFDDLDDDQVDQLLSTMLAEGELELL